MIHVDPAPAAQPSVSPRPGFQTPCVTEHSRRWDPVQGREVFLPPSERPSDPAGCVQDLRQILAALGQRTAPGLR